MTFEWIDKKAEFVHIGQIWPPCCALGKTQCGKKPAQVLTNLQQLCHDGLGHMQHLDLLACHGFANVIQQSRLLE